MRLITIYLPHLTERDAPYLAAFREYIGGQMTHPNGGGNATAAAVIVSRAREKLARAPEAEEVDLITSAHYAESALNTFGHYRGSLGPWLTHLKNELESAVRERAHRDKQERNLDAERNFETVARRARTVREHHRVRG